MEGVFIRFPHCVHGGHAEHVEEWLAVAEECPLCGMHLWNTTPGHNEDEKRRRRIGSGAEVGCVERGKSERRRSDVVEDMVEDDIRRLFFGSF